MIKIVSIAGARPQFIKTGIMHRAILRHEQVQHIIVHTGQHYDAAMSDAFFRDLQIPAPSHYLNINQLSHGAMTGRMLESLEKVLIKEAPALVVVYGDTNSTLAGALAAKKLHLPVAHIEAGLRSFDMQMPEEVNRILTDRISDLLFCPTVQALLNLETEGYRHFGCELHRVGDVMFDAALHFRRFAKKQVLPLPFVLATLHREETLQSPRQLNRVVDALNHLHQHMCVLFPAHPRTRAALLELDVPIHFPLVPPMGYLDMLQALEQCSCVVTDSGGLQKEAYFFRKPCITVRNNTEWTELVQAGANVLWKEDSPDLFAVYTNMLKSNPDFNGSFYGTGNTCDVIVEKILGFIKRREP